MIVGPDKFEELWERGIKADLTESEDKKLLIFVSSTEADSVCAVHILQGAPLTWCTLYYDVMIKLRISSSNIVLAKFQSWEQNLGPKQLHLLGVENVRIPAQQPLYGGVAPKPQIKLSPIMPLRQRATSVPGMDQSGAGPSPVAAAATAAAAAALTPQRGYLPGRRPDASPYSSSPVVTTPEQLKGFLDSWDVQTAAVEPQEVGYQPFGYPQSYEGMVSPPQAPQGAFAVRSMGTPEGLKQGLAAPTYRPSILPSRKAGVVASPDGRLRPTRDATVKEILHRLVTDQRTLEVWTERMREWLASQLLQPLVAAINAAHKDVIASAGKLGWANMQLSPLASEEGGNSAAGSRVSSAAAVEADDEVLIAQLREQLVARLRGGPQQPGNAEALACLQAVNNYQRLACLLKGEQPRGMLPPSPRGYVVTRLQQLAEGTCVKDFSWNSGGRWQGKPWTPDLPTDSALIFYLFAAFLDAPRWQFALEDTTVAHPSSGGPLFVGSLPTRQPQAYYALLPVRPPNLSKGAMAVLGLGLGTREPHFTLVLNGEPLLTLSNYTAVFHALLLWLQSVKTAAGGIVGGRSLDYLRLAPVLKPAERNYNLFSGKWFGIWS